MRQKTQSKLMRAEFCKYMRLNRMNLVTKPVQFRLKCSSFDQVKMRLGDDFAFLRDIVGNTAARGPRSLSRCLFRAEQQGLA